MGFTAQIRNDSGDYVTVQTQSELVRHVKAGKIVSLWGNRAVLEELKTMFGSKDVPCTDIQYSRNGNTYLRVNGATTFDVDDLKKGL